MQKTINEPLNPQSQVKPMENLEVESKPLYKQPRPEGFKESPAIEGLINCSNYVNFQLPPGPGLLPFAYLVNFNKGTMGLYLYGLMVYYDNFSTGAWIYLALHGTYGFFWVFKDTVFPDPGFMTKTTFMSLLFTTVVGLIPYYFLGYWMMSKTGADREVSNERLFVATVVFIHGLLYTVMTDAQKYLVLRERRGLITHCMNGWSRNLNYVGEMMLYGSFWILIWRWEPAVIFAWMWGIVFVLKMTMKEYSLSMKEGWDEYKAKSWWLLPKLYNSNLLSILFYLVLLVGGYLCYRNGGLEATTKLITK